MELGNDGVLAGDSDNSNSSDRGQPFSSPKGLHRLMVTFADARAKDLENQRVDLAMHYPYAQTTWKGIAPVLEMSGPGLKRQPVPEEWLKR